MMKTNEELARSLRRIIRQLHSAVTGIQAVAVITSDGLPQASALTAEIDEDRFGAMSATLLALAEQAAAEIRSGTLRQVLVEGEKGRMLLVQAGSDQVLAVSTDTKANIGRVFIEARKTADRVGEISKASS